MIARLIPQAKQVEDAAAATTPSMVFDHAFRARLRDLLVWRRDVRRFRRDPLPDGVVESLIELACLAPSVGLSQPWRFVVVEDGAARAAIRKNFADCNAQALATQTPERASLYARLKLAGLDEAPAHFAVFADRSTAQGHGLGRHTMPEMIDYSAVLAVHTIWLAARAQGIGMGWVSILDPKLSRRFLMSLRSGHSSAISVSATRRRTIRSRNLSRPAGSTGGYRRRSSSGAERRFIVRRWRAAAAPPANSASPG